MKLKPVLAFLAGAGYALVVADPNIRNFALKHLSKLPGLAVDGLNKLGDNYVPKTDEAAEQPEQSDN